MLPALREELTLYQGARKLDGSPTWSLHDPVRNIFFTIDWLTFEILSRWHLGDPKHILSAVTKETTIHPEPSDMEAIIRFLTENELTQNFSAKGTALYREQWGKRKQGILKRLTHGYLFFRVPLWRPNAWLGRALPWVEPLRSLTFLWLTVIALGVGLIETSRQWETFSTTLVDTMTPKGLAGLAVALVFAKFVHELGHAFSAKRHGCRVPSMGVAFLVLFPMAYTDVTEVWKLRDRRSRLEVGVAGIRTELMLAAWATMAWALLPDGLIRNAAFLLATTTWITTLAINASPFLRFDGYFLLMDWLRMPNLHARAFALGRWKVREILFGLGDVPPETLSRHRHRGLLAFAYATWTYRLIVFIGIAILIYTFLPKPLGPILAAVEIWWFILAPIWREIKEWGKEMDRIRTSPRLRIATFIFLGLLLIGAVPWNGRVQEQGLLRPSLSFAIIVPEPVRVVGLPVTDGSQVARDDVVASLEAPDLAMMQRQIEIQAATSRWQSVVSGVDMDLRTQARVIEATRARLDAELVRVGDEQARFIIRSPVAGRFFWADLDLNIGDWVGRNERIGTITGDGPWQVITYLPESDINRIALGNSASFHPESEGTSPYKLIVASIDQDATRILRDGALASTGGGRISVRKTRAGLVPETALYRVVLEPIDEKESFMSTHRPEVLRGMVSISGQRKAPLGDFVRAAAALLVLEAGF